MIVNKKMTNFNIVHFKISDIFIFNNNSRIFKHIFIFYHINNKEISKIIIDNKGYRYEISNNPAYFNSKIIDFIQLNDIKITELLNSNDNIIKHMGLTILSNKYKIKLEL